MEKYGLAVLFAAFVFWLAASGRLTRYIDLLKPAKEK